METKQAPLPAEEFKAYEELAAEAENIDELVTVREMLEADTGAENHQIRVEVDNGEVQTIKVTDLGKVAFKDAITPTLAVHSEDWHTEEK